MFENEHNLEERVIILRDKAAREGINIGDDVIDFIAQKYSVPQALKGALINVSAYAARRQLPITIELARHVLDGTRLAHLSPLDNVIDGGAAEGDTSSNLAEVATHDTIASPDVQRTYDTVPTFAEPELDTPAVPHQFEAPSFVQNVNPVISMTPDEATGTLFEIAPNEEESYEEILGAETPQEQASVGGESVSEKSNESLLSFNYEPATVWFVPMRTQRKKSLIERVGTAVERAGLTAVIDEGDKVAIKVHFGEKGNTGFVSPLYIREIVRLVKEAGGKPFLTDANTLYSGMRDNAVDHLTCAIQNGFSYATVEAPLIIADGLSGREGEDVEISGTKHFDSVRIGSAAVHADAMIVVSHVKGHGEAGFGGAFKNVGMGLGARSAKQRMHSAIKPHVDQDKCTRCKRCSQWCPVHCIDMGAIHNGKAFIREEECIGCGECVAACAYGAIKVNWDTNSSDFQEKIVEHTLGALKGKERKTIYVNFLTNITPECDCWSFSDAAIVPDIGILASRDIVAIDQASYDKVTKATGNALSVAEGMKAGTDKFLAMHNVDVNVTMHYAEELGMGTRQYVLKEIG